LTARAPPGGACSARAPEKRKPACAGFLHCHCYINFCFCCCFYCYFRCYSFGTALLLLPVMLCYIYNRYSHFYFHYYCSATTV